MKKRKMMFCYDKHSNLLCIIENIAISRMSYHSDGIYIYVERKSTYGIVENEWCIKCDWAKSYEIVTSRLLEHSKNTIVILNKDIVCSEVEQKLIGF